jgi:DHA1 family bicyclomycin/chloramphenicol resistance-like MFS transporter
MTPPQSPSLAVLVAITAINPLALNIVQPALPEMARALAISYGTAQLALSLYLVASAVSQIGLGPLSDRFGRRPVALGGIAIYVAGSIICLLATSIWMLSFGRVIQAAGGIAGFVMARAALRDMHGLDAAAARLGDVMVPVIVVPMIAPLFGGWIAERGGYEGVFLFTSAVGAGVLVVAFFLLHETHHAHARTTQAFSLSAFRILMTSRPFLAQVATLSFSSAIFFAFLAGAPYLVIELQHQGPTTFGAWYMLASVGYMAGNFLSGRFAVRVGVGRILAAGMAFTVVGVVLVAAAYAAFPASTAAIFIAAMPIWIGNGLTMPSTTASALSVRPELAGTASGLLGAGQLGLGAFVALITAYALGATGWPMVAVMGISMLLMLVGYFSTESFDALRRGRAADGD